MDAALIINPVFNTDGSISSWSFLPDDTRKHIAYILTGECNQIAFHYYDSTDINSDLKCLDELYLQPVSLINVGDDFNVMLYEYDEYHAYLLGETCFKYWGMHNSFFNDDVFYFYNNGIKRVTVFTCENIILFHNVKTTFLQKIERCNDFFLDNVFSVINGKISAR